MSQTLASVACKKGLCMGFAEVRRLISGGGITVNGEPAKAWDQLVYTGDIIKVGKRRTAVV